MPIPSLLDHQKNQTDRPEEEVKSSKDQGKTIIESSSNPKKKKNQL